MVSQLLSDLFHEDVPDDYVQSAVHVMQTANWHTYQVLTKQSERIRDLLQTTLADAAAEPHIWWGVSVENRRHAFRARSSGMDRVRQGQPLRDPASGPTSV
jgi:protein gp37